ncbi:Hypothetical predicted protein [Paramuricea clavata]|uniref:Uncharacterized protein n=1 Tax=Paramuricea clavata TaxID=317549 RepID=A0A7D9ICP2_PARCT|nr:Hypothetical predicted protein [Paramuricea clavata]
MYSDSEINTDHMRRIVSRLPYHNQAKWRDVASFIMKKRKSPPNFQDLTEFLGDRARAENDPTYGRSRDPTKDRRPKQTREENKSNYEHVSSFATQFGSNRYPSSKECPVCKQNHKLETSKIFRLEKPVAERRKLVLSLVSNVSRAIILRDR